MLPRGVVRIQSVALYWVLLSGCGPIQSTSLIVDAQAELAAARTVEAATHAPFEFTAAEVYLDKAKEEQSYAEFEVAVRFAQKALSCARVARMQGETATRDALGATRPTHATVVKCRTGPDRIGPVPIEDPKIRRAAYRALQQKQNAAPPPVTPPPPAPPPPAVPPPPTETEPQDPPAVQYESFEPPPPVISDSPPAAPPPQDDLPQGDATPEDAEDPKDGAPEESQTPSTTPDPEASTPEGVDS